MTSRSLGDGHSVENEEKKNQKQIPSQIKLRETDSESNGIKEIKIKAQRVTIYSESNGGGFKKNKIKDIQ